MPRKARMDQKKIKGTAEDKIPEKRKKAGRSKKPANKKENASMIMGEPKSPGVVGDTVLRGPVSGRPALIQSNYGNKGDFEVVVPLAVGGIARYFRANDDEMLSWHGPICFGADVGPIEGIALIQSNFGEKGNLELVATDVGGHRLMHFWCDYGQSFEWHGPNNIFEKSLVPEFSGNPAIIHNEFESEDYFEVVISRAKGGFAHFLRDNHDPSLPWYGPFDFAADSGIFDSLTLIKSNFGRIGSLELVARSGDQLIFFWRDSDPKSKWHGPFPIASGAAGTPSMVQSTFGFKGNFELVAPLASGGLAQWWRDNDDSHLHWYGPFMFGLNLGKVDAVSLIQSNWGEPGHLELVAQADGQLAFFWRDSGPDFRWNGPQFITI